MKQAEIEQMHVWLCKNYTEEQTLTKEQIAQKLGITLNNLNRHLRLIGLNKVKTMHTRKKPYKVTQKASVLPIGAMQTRHGFVMQQGAKTVHRMVG